VENVNAYLGIHEGREMLSEGGAAQVFEQILSTGLPSLYRTAHRLLGNSADAEDAVQDALLAAYTHLDQFKGQAQMSSWLTAILLNCARMQLRIRRRYTPVPLDEPIGEVGTPSVSDRLADHRPNPEEECKDSELSARLTRFHTQLSPTLRRTFQLRDVDGLSIRETAQILKIPIGTVKTHTARARKNLKDLMRRSLRPRSRSLRDSRVGRGSLVTSRRSRT
jgi:RNA polymerase sigma-70 factor (ECF subfamily)